MAKNQEDQKQSKIPLIVSISVLAIAVGCYFLIPDFQDFCKEAVEVLLSGDRERTQKWVEQYGVWGPIIIIVGQLVQMFLFVVPTVLLMTVSILAYGPWLGSLYSLAGITLASVVAYFIGLRAGNPFLNKLLGESTKDKFVEYTDKYGAWLVALARVNPIISNDTISFVSGFVKLSFVKFLIATVVATIPLLALISYLGQDQDRLKSGMIWISAVALVLAVGYFIYREYFEKDN